MQSAVFGLCHFIHEAVSDKFAGVDQGVFFAGQYAHRTSSHCLLLKSASTGDPWDV